ncbi:biopolymer transporter ExbD [Mucilaginibacter sp. BT774]|uniref:ExbD/TolR family protein n=1 Tax=Mucilaginibacter sp. BT774 TaxID=3062276 RepID=UPI002676F74C|nr:biopolymer transporter ExbD [Mucilaginibacter sp. BT774]MDO3626002.1 biopolymer transporter ExbD [Mucilaginibacter sp. BT774]
MAELTTSGNSGRKGRRRTPTPRIDLTAMVDLAFLLITFFIMATSLAKPKAMDLAMPVKGPDGSVPETRTMSVCLGKDDKVMWYMGMPEKPLTKPQLVDFGKAGLRAVLADNNKKAFQSSGKPLIVILKPSDHSVYNNFVSALDEFSISNIQTYAVANITPKDVDMLKQKGAF